MLKDSLVIRVTKNNIPIWHVPVKFDKEDCNFFPSDILFTDINGQIRYLWTLNGKTGDQALKLTALDSLYRPVDSVTAHAEGRFFMNAWQLADCLPHAGINDLCESGTGKLFCGSLAFDYPYFSDNNGVSWQRLISFPVNNLEIRQMVAQGNDVYIATRHNGIYYSPDNGASWQNRSIGITDTREVASLNITRSGKLFLSTYYKPLFMSVNKGLVWTPVTNGINFNDQLYNLCETSTGVLYMVSGGEDLYKSIDGGNSWNIIHPNVAYSVQSVFIDDNDDLYIGTFGSVAYIYKSTDNGNSWTLKYSSPQVPGVYLEVKPFFKVNGYYYFMIAGYGIVKTQNFSAFQLLTNRYFFEYLVTHNNAVLVPGSFDGLWYNQNP